MHPQDGEGDSGSWWTFQNVGLTVLLISVGIALTILVEQGRDEARAAGGREATLRAQVDDIEETVRDGRAAELEALRALATELRLWKSELDEYNTILATMATTRGCPPPAPRKGVESAPQTTPENP